MVFGRKKPTIFDEKQDKALKALVANQAILIKNNAGFIRDGKNYWAWIKHLEKSNKTLLNRLESDNKALLNRLAALESTIQAMKEKDKQFAAMFQNLAAASVEAVKKEEEG